MIALTQEKREELIKECEFDIKCLKDRVHRKYAANNPLHKKHLENALMRQELALESLTSPVLGYIHKHIWSSYKQAVCSGDEFGLEAYAGAENHFAVYSAPPVPEIKLPGISELVEQQGCLPAVRDVAIWDFAISETKRLNGLGE